jgi:hypothetical protein
MFHCLAKFLSKREVFPEINILHNMFFTPLESPAIYSGEGEKNFHSLLRVGVKAPSFLMGFTERLHLPAYSRWENLDSKEQIKNILNFFKNLIKKRKRDIQKG